MSLPDVQCERVDFKSFENQFRIVLRDTQTGISILMTASVPALISLAHAMLWWFFVCQPVHLDQSPAQQSWGLDSHV